MKELMDFILKVTEGNPGALTFATDALSQCQGTDGDMQKWLVAFQRADLIGLRGTALYKVWNDVYGRNVDKALDALVELSAQALLELGGAK